MMMSEANVGRMLRNANERERILDPKQLLHHEKYTPFKSCTACHICTKSFGTFRRRAHCQLCGNVVCRSCTLDYIADVAGKIVDARVCSPCDGKLDVEFRQRTSSRAIAGTVLSRSFMSRPNPLATPSSSSSHVSRKKSPSRHRPESHPSSDIATESTPYFYALDFNWSHAWPKPPFIPHDVERIKSLSKLDVRRHDFMQSAVHFACEVFDTPIGGVSFIDEHQQWFASSRGLAQEFIPRQASICAHTIALAAPMAVLDLGQDIRFRHNPLVTGPNLGFYAGAPILSPDGHAVGTVFVMDLAPRSACDLSKLAVFAHVVSTKLADVASVRTDSASPTEASIASHSPADRVISAVDVMSPLEWTPRTCRGVCQVCHNRFSLFLRKRHCRVCGDIVCKNCVMLVAVDGLPSSRKPDTLTPRHPGTPVRDVIVCLECVFKPTTPSQTGCSRTVPTKTMELDDDEDLLPTTPRADGDVIPTLARNQSFDLDQCGAIFTTDNLRSRHPENAARPPNDADVAWTSSEEFTATPDKPKHVDYTPTEIHAMLLALLHQSNDIQTQLHATQCQVNAAAATHRT